MNINMRMYFEFKWNDVFRVKCEVAKSYYSHNCRIRILIMTDPWYFLTNLGWRSKYKYIYPTKFDKLSYANMTFTGLK